MEILKARGDVDDYSFDDIVETFADRVPAETMPIGDDPGGNQFLDGLTKYELPAKYRK